MNRNLAMLLFGAGAVVALVFLVRRPIAGAIEGLGEAGSDIGLFFSDIFDRRTLDELTDSSLINCDHFSTATARGRDLRERCLRGEL